MVLNFVMENIKKTFDSNNNPLYNLPKKKTPYIKINLDHTLGTKINTL